MNSQTKKNQSGLVMTEVAILGAALMIILFSAIEMGRMLFAWNTLDAVTQRAARVAAVCPPNHSQIAQIAMFGNPGGSSMILPGFVPGNLQISYHDAGMAPTASLPDMAYVQARIVNYQHQLAIPFLSNRTIISPPFPTVIPVESLGFIPFDGVRQCFGAA